MDKAQTLKALALLQLAYPQDMSKDRLKLYVEMLKDIPPELLAVAVTYCINNCTFPPSIAELRKAAQKGSDTAKDDTAADAWGRVQKAIASVGYTGRPDLSDDPVLAKVVKQFGWPEICKTPADDTAILRAQFRKAYEQTQERMKDRDKFQQAGQIAGVNLAALGVDMNKIKTLKGDK